MGRIAYSITEGELPITVKLIEGGSVLQENIHNSHGSFSFEDLPISAYSLEFYEKSTQLCGIADVTPCEDCPDGFIPVGDKCIKYVETEPTYVETTYTVVKKTADAAYGVYGPVVFESGWNYDGTGTYERILPITNTYWHNQPYPSLTGVLNRTSVWGSTTTNNQDIGFSFCIDIAVEKSYYVGFACDNYGKIKLNGEFILEQNRSALMAMFGSSDLGTPHKYWYIYPVTMTAGKNVIEVLGHNVESVAGVGIQIYNCSKQDLINATNLNPLGDKILFSSEELVGQALNYEYSSAGGYHGYSCPEGYALDTCNGVPICVQKTELNCGESPPASTTTTSAPVATTTTSAPVATTTTSAPVATTTTSAPVATTTTTSTMGLYLDNMPGGMSQHGFVTYGDKLYAFGGDSSKQVYEYDVITNQWSTKTPIPTVASQRQSIGTNTVGDKIYLIGGMDGTAPSAFTGEVLEYDPVADTYTTKTPKPTAVEDFGTAVVGTKIYCFGGLKNVSGTATPTNVLEIYDTETDTWDTSKAPMPTTKVLGDFGASCNGKVYAIGSEKDFATYPILAPVGNTYEYDPLTDQWTRKTDTPLLSCYREAVSIGDYIYIMSGAGTGSYNNPDNLNWGCYRYNTISGVWNRLQDVPYASLGSALTVHGGKVFMSGGNNLGYGGTPHLTNLYRFDNIDVLHENQPTTTTTTTAAATTTTTAAATTTTTAAATTTTTAAATTLVEDLVLLYELDETSGTVVNDETGIHDGTNVNAVVNQAGKLDKAYLFNGTNSEVKTGITDQSYRTGDEFTISMWFNHNFSASTGADQLIAKAGPNSPDTEFMLSQNGTSLNAIRFFVRDGGVNALLSSSTILNAGTWYHVVVMCTGSQIKMYINGVEQATSPQSISTGMINTSYEIKLGYFSGITSIRYNGLLDQTAIWKRVLTESEISQLYNSGNGIAYVDW